MPPKSTKGKQSTKGKSSSLRTTAKPQAVPPPTSPKRAPVPVRNRTPPPTILLRRLHTVVGYLWNDQEWLDRTRQAGDNPGTTAVMVWSRFRNLHGYRFNDNRGCIQHLLIDGEEERCVVIWSSMYGPGTKEDALKSEYARELKEFMQTDEEPQEFHFHRAFY